MDNMVLATIAQSVYLLYMYFVFKTTTNFYGASLEESLVRFGDIFVHNSSRKYNNKICDFGRIMACVAVAFWIWRVVRFQKKNSNKRRIMYSSIAFDVVGLYLAYCLNLNAFIYVLPVTFTEMFVLWTMTTSLEDISV
jgi:hypothetical protein